MSHPNALRVQQPSPSDRLVRIETRQCVLAGEAHEIEPEWAYRLALEVLLAAIRCDAAADPERPLSLVDDLAELAGLL